MYLDTDIILALIKEEDWLKEKVKKIQVQNAKTSALTIIEARLVLEREYSRIESTNALDKIKKQAIEITIVDKKVIEKSQELMQQYPNIGIFDSIHAATALILNEKMVSTDHIFHQIVELSVKDPRTI